MNTARERRTASRLFEHCKMQFANCPPPIAQPDGLVVRANCKLGNLRIFHFAFCNLHFAISPIGNRGFARKQGAKEVLTPGRMVYEVRGSRV